MPTDARRQAWTTDEPLEDAEPAAVPLAEVKPALPSGSLRARLLALVKYMARTEVHTYAFSVAANAILSLFPFIVMMMTLSRHVFNSVAMFNAVERMTADFLPSNQDFIVSHMRLLVHPHKGVQLYSLIMLVISSTGVFLPLEVALNGVWGVRENRSYFGNQMISLCLALGIGAMAMCSVAIATSWDSILSAVFFHHTQNAFYAFFSGTVRRAIGSVLAIVIFFLIYWILPNRKVPARAVLPTALVTGILWELSKRLYIAVLPKLDFAAVYGPFYVSVGLMIWAFLSGLLLLAGGHFSATRYALCVAREDEREEKQEKRVAAEKESDGRRS